jgi:hypothetical protein
MPWSFSLVSGKVRIKGLGVILGLYIGGVKQGGVYWGGVRMGLYKNGVKVFGSASAPIEDLFSFTVEDGGEFGIPVCGMQGEDFVFQPYDWVVEWGDGTSEEASGVGDLGSFIPHLYVDGETSHRIIIRPNGGPSQGWFNAFGCGDFPDGVSAAKIKKLHSPITSVMRTMSDFAFSAMFRGCSGLTEIPVNLLPAKTLAPGCYSYMFYGCSGLTEIPVNLLPAKTIAASCYSSMFRGCSGLTEIPVNLLPAETIAVGCYYRMFYGCSGLTEIPVNLLPAKPLASYCYESMFQGCGNLSGIGNMDASWFSARSGRPQSGMFASCTNISSPISYGEIPAGWK